MDFTDKIALITGGSSGIGLALAKQLAARHARVWILARNKERLTQAAQAVEAARSGLQPCGWVSADVTNCEAVNTAVAEIVQKAGLPDLVINSAGGARPGYFQDLDMSIFRETMDSNYFGALYVTKAVIPGMIQRGSGRIVNICSLAGLIGVFGYTAYGASKFALRGFSDTLRAEMKAYGIKISIAFPPDTDTPQLAYENQFKPFETRAISGSASVMSPDTVAKDILRGIEKGRYMILPGFESKMIYHLSRLAGGWTYNILDWIVADARKKNRSLQGNDQRRTFGE
jgi:3-dehydrosphinganine reductase